MTRSAVIIGVNKTGGLPALQAAVKSAHAVAQWAQAQGFANVELITDEVEPVTLQRIKDAIQLLVGTTEQLLVYFSGHGINIHMNEYWLLSAAPLDTQAAVNVSGSEVLARQVGIDHVILVSDACRTAADSIQAQYVSGGEIFPNIQAPGPARGVDLFFATTLGAPALEIRDPTQSATQFRALYTDVLVEALEGRCRQCVEAAQDGEKPIGLVRPWPLRFFLQNEVPKRFVATALATSTPTPIPDARITSPPTAWVARVEAPTAPVERGAVREKPVERPSPPPPDGYVESGAAPGRSTDSWSIPGVMRAITLPSGVQPNQLEQEAARHASTFGPTHFETRCGFKVRGALIGNALAADGVVSVGLRQDVVAVRPNNVRPTSVLLEFDSGRCAVLPAIPEFIASLTIENGGLVDVAYEPSDNSARWPEYQSRLTDLRRLRGRIAAAAKFGVFRLEGDDADTIAREMQQSKWISPSMAIYAAYAYHAQHRYDRLGEMLTYLAAEVGTCFFDVALLAGVLGTSATRRPPAARGPMTVPTSRSIPPLPLFPLLAQGFALLSAFGVQVPPSVSSNRLLAPSLWTMFEPPAVSQLRAAIVRKEIP